MAAKKCQKCGKVNPRFFSHCVACGAKLADDSPGTGKIPGWLKTGLILCTAILLIVFVIIPGVRYSQAFGEDFTQKVSEKSAAESQLVAEFPVNHSVENSGLEITIHSARDTQNTYGSNKFYLISVYLKNTRTAGNIQVSNNNFELIDSEGSKYSPNGIGSKVMYDLNPTEGTAAELTFIIPQKVTAKKLRFTFPGTSSLASNRPVASFVL
jgi:hypothetical protein